MDIETNRKNLEQSRKNLPIFTIRNKLISEIQRNSCLILLGENLCFFFNI
jgi:hypothetical protein